MSNQDLVSITKTYYDSHDADEFYHTVWGGEDIHIGLYNSETEKISDASNRTVVEMLSRLGEVSPGTRIIDIGAGYGGAARYIAKNTSAHVTCLNLSEKENRRNIEKNEAQGCAEQIDVITGNFEALPFEENSFDVAWSQDAILHSDNKEQVFREVYRVLKPGGKLIFTDPMQANEVPDGVLDPILERIHLKEMGSVRKYKGIAEKLGFQVIEADEKPHQLQNHYTRVREELELQKNKLLENCSEEYINRMKKGLTHWVEGARQGYLNWGILIFQK